MEIEIPDDVDMSALDPSKREMEEELRAIKGTGQDDADAAARILHRLGKMFGQNIKSNSITPDEKRANKDAMIAFCQWVIAFWDKKIASSVPKGCK